MQRTEGGGPVDRWTGGPQRVVRPVDRSTRSASTSHLRASARATRSLPGARPRRLPPSRHRRRRGLVHQQLLEPAHEKRRTARGIAASRSVGRRRAGARTRVLRRGHGESGPAGSGTHHDDQLLGQPARRPLCDDAGVRRGRRQDDTRHRHVRAASLLDAQSAHRHARRIHPRSIPWGRRSPDA